MKFFVVPQNQAVLISPRSEGLANTAMIRITTDAGFTPLKFPDEFIGVLELRFADIIDGDRDKWSTEAIAHFESMGLVTHPITEDQARQIVTFAERMRDADCGHMVVHCQAGYSRSPAVAIALTEHLGLVDENRRLVNLAGTGRFCPNPTVLDRIRLVTGARDRKQQELEQLWREVQ